MTDTTTPAAPDPFDEPEVQAAATSPTVDTPAETMTSHDDSPVVRTWDIQLSNPADEIRTVRISGIELQDVNAARAAVTAKYPTDSFINAESVNPAIRPQPR